MITSRPKNIFVKLFLPIVSKKYDNLDLKIIK